MDKKVYKAFARYNGKLTNIFTKAETIDLALEYVKAETGVSEVISISEHDDTIIL